MKRITILLCCALMFFAAQLSYSQIPHSEYPRPQMVRSDWQSLNGSWSYAITDAGADDFTAEGQITVPFAVESKLSGVRKTVGSDKALWYEREFTVPAKWRKSRILLHFGAVDWKAEVWVNGKKAGEHTGGYTPFTFDITDLLAGRGAQKLRVKVWDGTDMGFQPRGKQVANPRGIWYTSVTGIWQSVWMEPVGGCRVENYEVVADLKNKSFTVHTGICGEADVKVELFDRENGGIIASSEGADAVLDVPDMKLWSPESPYLYGLRIVLSNGKKVLDKVEGYAAAREISVMRDSSPNYYKRLALNGKIGFQLGPLDQGWWPDGLYTAPSDEALRSDIERMKAFGFNAVRKHIKVEPARWYYWCDVLGLMVWQDMPCIADHSGDVNAFRPEEVSRISRNVWSRDSYIGGTDCAIPQQWKDNYYKEWGEIMASLKGFQCIVMWIPFNEAWGQFDTEEVVRFTRAQDPTRLVNESSGGNFHFCGDVLDVHHYPCPAMNAFESKFVNVLGEYGGIGFPIPGHLWKENDNWGYGGVKKSAQEVLQQYTEFAKMLEPFILTGCSAAIYTQLTDVENEVNGLMTYDRMIKLPVDELRKVNEGIISNLK